MPAAGVRGTDAVGARLDFSGEAGQSGAGDRSAARRRNLASDDGRHTPLDNR